MQCRLLLMAHKKLEKSWLVSWTIAWCQTSRWTAETCLCSDSLCSLTTSSQSSLWKFQIRNTPSTTAISLKTRGKGGQRIWTLVILVRTQLDYWKKNRSLQTIWSRALYHKMMTTRSSPLGYSIRTQAFMIKTSWSYIKSLSIRTKTGKVQVRATVGNSVSIQGNSSNLKMITLATRIYSSRTKDRSTKILALEEKSRSTQGSEEDPHRLERRIITQGRVCYWTTIE
jgi:hypothetical protein